MQRVIREVGSHANEGCKRCMIPRLMHYTVAQIRTKIDAQEAFSSSTSGLLLHSAGPASALMDAMLDAIMCIHQRR